MNKRKKILENIVEGGIITIGVCSIIPILAMIGHIIYKGIPAISWSIITQMPADGMRSGGIMPAIVGTFYLTTLTIIFAVPFGVLTGVYLTEYANDSKLKDLINLTIINLAGIPSVIYGLFGAAFFVAFLGGKSILAGSLTLAVMSLPIIIIGTKEALEAVDKDIKQASVALGATKFESVFKVILPSASSGILTSIILSISRVAGETAPIMFTAVVFSRSTLPTSILEDTMTLPYHLYVISTNISEMPLEMKDATVFVLVGITLGFNLLGALIRKKLNHK